MTSYGDPEAFDYDLDACVECERGDDHDHCEICGVIVTPENETKQKLGLVVHQSCERYLR